MIGKRVEYAIEGDKTLIGDVVDIVTIGIKDSNSDDARYIPINYYMIINKDGVIDKVSPASLLKELELTAEDVLVNEVVNDFLLSIKDGKRFISAYNANRNNAYTIKVGKELSIIRKNR